MNFHTCIIDWFKIENTVLFYSKSIFNIIENYVQNLHFLQLNACTVYDVKYCFNALEIVFTVTYMNNNFELMNKSKNNHLSKLY